MNSIEYESTQQRLMMCVEFLMTLDLDDFLSQIETSEAIGPLLHPSEWMRAAALGGDEALRKVKDVARAARKLQQVYREAWPEKAERIAAEVAKG